MIDSRRSRRYLTVLCGSDEVEPSWINQLEDGQEDMANGTVDEAAVPASCFLFLPP